MVMNVGMRPTMEDRGGLTVEVNALPEPLNPIYSYLLHVYQ